jgi:hypothetical protein
MAGVPASNLGAGSQASHEQVDQTLHASGQVKKCSGRGGLPQRRGHVCVLAKVDLRRRAAAHHQGAHPPAMPCMKGAAIVLKATSAP